MIMITIMMILIIMITLIIITIIMIRITIIIINPPKFIDFILKECFHGGILLHIEFTKHSEDLHCTSFFKSN